MVSSIIGVQIYGELSTLLTFSSTKVMSNIVRQRNKAYLPLLFFSPIWEKLFSGREKINSPLIGVKQVVSIIIISSKIICIFTIK